MADMYDRWELSYVDFCVSQSVARSAESRRATGGTEPALGSTEDPHTAFSAVEGLANHGGADA